MGRPHGHPRWSRFSWTTVRTKRPRTRRLQRLDGRLVRSQIVERWPSAGQCGHGRRIASSAARFEWRAQRHRAIPGFSGPAARISRLADGRTSLGTRRRRRGRRSAAVAPWAPTPGRQNGAVHGSQVQCRAPRARPTVAPTTRPTRPKRVRSPATSFSRPPRWVMPGRRARSPRRRHAAPTHPQGWKSARARTRRARTPPRGQERPQRLETQIGLNVTESAASGEPSRATHRRKRPWWSRCRRAWRRRC